MQKIERIIVRAEANTRAQLKALAEALSEEKGVKVGVCRGGSLRHSGRVSRVADRGSQVTWSLRRQGQTGPIGIVPVRFTRPFTLSEAARVVGLGSFARSGASQPSQLEGV